MYNINRWDIINIRLIDMSSDDGSTTITIEENENILHLNGKVLKKEFEFLFENVEEINIVRLIPTRNDELISLDKLFQLSKDINLSSISNECIYNLYTFLEGVQFLFNHISELQNRGLLMYMFSSPFLTVEQLQMLIYDSIIFENCDDTYIDHLVYNPNIYE
jgi:hypothetical protein